MMRGVVLLILSTLLTSTSTSPTPPPHPWLSDPSQPVAQRVEALLSSMTITDKLWQLQRPSYSPSLSSTGAGILEFQSVYANTLNATQVVQNRNAIQKAFLSSGPGARLGIPVSFRLFSIHGGEAYGVTFPEGPGLGASFDTLVATQVAAAIAAEGRALGADMAFYVINLWADPRFGRQEEGVSEEPTLTSAFAEAFVVGSQGALQLPPDAYLNDTENTIAALFKHVGAYGAAAGGLNGGRADIPEYAIREVYLKPWRRAAAAGGRGVMPSHNTVIGVPAHGSPWLLTDRLRGEFNMTKGLFVSDTGDVQALGTYRLCDGDAACAALAINAGVDVEQVPGSTYLSLPQAVQEGLTTMDVIDDAVRRVLNHKFSLRLFDSPYVNESLAELVVNSLQHRNLAQQAAEEGAVLLINNPFPLPSINDAKAAASAPILPLPTNTPLNIAVIGPNGGCGNSGSGAGTYPNLCEAQTSLLGNYAEVLPPSTGVATLAEALVDPQFGGNVNVSFARGCNIDDFDPSLLPAAIQTAQQSDVIVAVLGDSLNSCGESHDRDSLDLPGGQMTLLRSLASVNKPLILVLVNCRAATFGESDGNAVLNNVSALLVTWRSGQMGSIATARLLFGAVNPSGRLPNSWVRGVGQTNGGGSPWLQQRVSLFNGPATGAEGRMYGTYVDSVVSSNAMPLFSFGEGLSYTTYSLSSLTVSVDAQNSSYPVSASFAVTNTGKVQGSVVVQAYLQDPIGVTLIVRPWKRLVAFTRVSALSPGQALPISLPLRSDDIAIIGDDMSFGVRPGNYTLSIGLSSVSDAVADGGLVAGFTLPGGGKAVAERRRRR